MTITERIEQLKKTLKELENKKKRGCKDCDNEELIYQLKKEIKRLRKCK